MVAGRPISHPGTQERESSWVLGPLRPLPGQRRDPHAPRQPAPGLTTLMGRCLGLAALGSPDYQHSHYVGVTRGLGLEERQPQQDRERKGPHNARGRSKVGE